MEEKLERLSKVMSARGICSRREAEHFIDLGQILVDGKIVTVQGTKVSENAVIELLPSAQRYQSKKVTILLNKPIGYVSNLPEKGYVPAIELITFSNQIKGRNEPSFNPGHRNKLAVAGRLDIDSKGLLVLSQDGVLVKRLIGQDSTIEKEYLVYVEGNISQESLKKLRFGLFLDGKPLKRAEVEILKPNLLKFVLREGKKRQIRRMCELVGLKVVGLKRIRIGKVLLGDLPEGKWRFLGADESF